MQTEQARTGEVVAATAARRPGAQEPEACPADTATAPTDEASAPTEETAAGEFPPGRYIATLAGFTQSRAAYSRPVEVSPHLQLAQARAEIDVGVDGQVQFGSIAWRWEGAPPQGARCLTSVDTFEASWGGLRELLPPVGVYVGLTRLWPVSSRRVEERTGCVGDDIPRIEREADTVIPLVLNNAGALVYCATDPFEPDNRARCLGRGAIAVLTRQ